MNAGPHRPFPRGALGALALITAVELTVARNESSLPNMVAENWQFSGRAARDATAGCQILCLGSSHMKFGAIPRVIEERTGRSAYNLAVCSGRMATSYFLLRRTLEAGVRPEALVVDCADPPTPRGRSEGFAEGLRVNLRNWPELLGARESYELARASGNPDFFPTILASQALPSLKSRFEIRKFLKAPGSKSRRAESRKVLLYARTWRANRGAFVLTRERPPAPTEAEGADAPPAPFDWARFAVDPLTEVYTQRLLDLAHERGIAVFWVLAPVEPGQISVQLRNGMFDYFSEFARAVQRRHPGVVVLDARRAHYPRRAFCDDKHLNLRGAVAFSADVAEVVRRTLGGPRGGDRWVSLPAFRERPPNPRWKDLEHSAVVLSSPPERR